MGLYISTDKKKLFAHREAVLIAVNSPNISTGRKDLVKKKGFCELWCSAEFPFSRWVY